MNKYTTIYVIKKRNKYDTNGGWKKILMEGKQKPEAWYSISRYPFKPVCFGTKEEAEEKVKEFKDPMFIYRVFEESHILI